MRWRRKQNDCFRLARSEENSTHSYWAQLAGEALERRLPVKRQEGEKKREKRLEGVLGHASFLQKPCCLAALGFSLLIIHHIGSIS